MTALIVILLILTAPFWCILLFFALAYAFFILAMLILVVAAPFAWIAEQLTGRPKR